MTPPALLVAHIRMGLRLSCCAVIFCKPPNKAFEDVSLPVRATPNQPIKVTKKGKNQPVRVKARPKTASMPEYRVTYPKPSMQVMATMAKRNRKSVRPKMWNIFPGLRPRMTPAKRAAKKQPVPVAVSQLRSNRAASAVAFCTTGAARNTLACKYGQSHPGGPGRVLASAITTLQGGAGGVRCGGGRQVHGRAGAGKGVKGPRSSNDIEDRKQTKQGNRRSEI